MMTPIHRYFIEKAHAALADHGITLDNVDAIAAWAEKNRQRRDIQGIIVAVDGTILATTVHMENATYVNREGIEKWGLMRHEIGFAMGEIRRSVGQDVLHLKHSELCQGAAPRR